MSTPTQLLYFSPSEYLSLERQSPFKHEYRGGSVYAMAGAKKAHVKITHNLDKLLGNHLDNSPCEVYVSDMKVRIESTNCFYYPDILVSCDDRELESDEDFVLHPKLIIEVLSKSTERFDRTDKFLDYQQIPSLQDYVLVSQHRMQVECFSKQGPGSWVNQCYGPGEMIEIPSIDFNCAIEKIYHKVMGLSV